MKARRNKRDEERAHKEYFSGIIRALERSNMHIEHNPEKARREINEVIDSLMKFMEIVDFC